MEVAVVSFSLNFLYVIDSCQKLFFFQNKSVVMEI